MKGGDIQAQGHWIEVMLDAFRGNRACFSCETRVSGPSLLEQHEQPRLEALNVRTQTGCSQDAMDHRSL